MPGIDGRTLREWRRARGWDVPQLARQLRHAATEPIAAHDGLVRMIRSWERGAHALSERYELLYRSLGFDDEAHEGDGTRASRLADRDAEEPRGAYATTTYATLGPVAPPRPETDIVEVCCRTPEGGIVFVAVPLRQLTGGVPGPRPAPHAEETRPAERFLAARRALRDNDNLFGPRDVIPLAMRQLAVIREESKSVRGRDRRELLLAQIQFADLLGWLYQDSREYKAAARWLYRALDWAHALGDDGCVAFILARKSQLACDMRDPVTAIAAAGAALRLATGLHPLTSAAAATYGAHGHALAGDATAARRLYDRARVALRDNDAQPAQWATFMDSAYVDVYQAHSLAALGEHAAAAAGFSAAIRGLRPGYHRDRGVYLAREARARAASREHDRAAELAAQAVAVGTETGSARIFAELAAVRDATWPARESPAVARFRTALSAAQR
jgi:tetratricopeptide (TPR) repeat protein